MTSFTHDIIVIGAGSGGLNIAGFMNKAGFKVLLIDKTDRNIGGDCLNFGCVPSKALIHVSRLFHDAKNAARFGGVAPGLADLSKVAGFVTEKREHIREHENAAHFQKLGMDVVLGKAEFAGKRSVLVNDKTYTAKRIVIATGSRPRPLKIPGAENVHIHTNETIFELTTLPKRLLVLGGGPIGVELGQAFGRLGSAVTIVQTRGVFLPKEDPVIASVLIEQLTAEGITLLKETKPVRFKDAHTLIATQGEKEVELSFDAILVSIGRTLNIDGLALEKADIQVQDDKIVVDRYLRTTNPDVFLCGDVAGSYQFTHAAELHAKIILSNIFKPRPLWKPVNYDHIGWVTYTSPEIATFGLDEGQLKERKISYERIVQDFQDEDRAIVDENTRGKLVLYIGKGKILGGSMVAENAGELVQELMLANTTGLTVDALFQKVYPYPTATRINRKAIGQVMARKLSPVVKRILRRMY